jgi:hypothetical protein
MYSVEGGLEVPPYSLIGISPHHLVHQFEFQEQRRAGPVKTHVIADSSLAFFDKRWENWRCR